MAIDPLNGFTRTARLMATAVALPMTDAEIRVRAGEIARGLDALDDMGDEEDQRQTLEALSSHRRSSRISTASGSLSADRSF